MSCSQTLHDMSGYEVKAWETHGIGLPCVKVVGLGVLHLTQTKPTQFGGRRKTDQRKERERKERKKEREKRRKKGRRKEGGVGIHSNKVGSFSTRDTLGLGPIQWPWSLVPTWELSQNSLNANCVHFLGILMLETDFWCRLNLLEKIMDAEFLCTTVYCLENWKEFLVCMCCVLV